MDQDKAIKLMQKLQKLAERRLKLEAKAASIIAELKMIKQAGGHEIKEFITKQGFSLKPYEVAKDETERDDSIPPEFKGDDWQRQD